MPLLVNGYCIKILAQTKSCVCMCMHMHGCTGHTSLNSYPFRTGRNGKGLAQAALALKTLLTWHRSLCLALLSPSVALPCSQPQHWNPRRGMKAQRCEETSPMAEFPETLLCVKSRCKGFQAGTAADWEGKRQSTHFPLAERSATERRNF